jgi:hypothetical protein
MIPEVGIQQSPQWLKNLDIENFSESPFPIQQILKDSAYYPSSGFDGFPVQFLSNTIQSFIYVDYGYTQQQLDAELTNYGFHGYQVIARRSLTETDLAPKGWCPIQLQPKDGNPLKFDYWIKKPFAEWIIFERQPEFTEEHGAKRFSLIYLCADGVAAFQALYVTNSIAPRVIAIIQPGIGFGNNWSDFKDRDSAFGSIVLGNPAGKPEYLLLGAWESNSECGCWPEYNELVRKKITCRQHYRLWKYGR